MNIAKLSPKSKQSLLLVNDDLDILSQDFSRLTGLECLQLISNATSNIAQNAASKQTPELLMFDRLGRLLPSLIQEDPICIIGDDNAALNKSAEYFCNAVWRQSGKKIEVVLCNIIKTSAKRLHTLISRCRSQIFLPISNLTIRCSLNAEETHNHAIEQILQTMTHNQGLRKYLLASLGKDECLICSHGEEQIRCFESPIN